MIVMNMRYSESEGMEIGDKARNHVVASRKR